MARSETTLTVSETFYSIQGESSYAGFPCLFIRLSGCNLRCSYCDARYTYQEPGRQMTVAELLAWVDQTPNVLVEVTGGEPLLQEGVYPLFAGLLTAGRTVLLETNGSINLGRVPAGVVKIMDIKCPDSGMHDQMDLANLARLTPQDEIKFVLSSRQDYQWAREAIATHRLENTAKLIFSPVTSRLPPALLAEWLMNDRLPVRLQIQLHTILWPHLSRGV